MNPQQFDSPANHLVRGMGKWDFVALIVNITVGAGILNPPFLIYQQADAQIQEPEQNSLWYFKLAIASVVNLSGNYTLLDMTSETHITQSFSSGSTLPAGYYKVTANVPTSNTINGAGVSYTNSYSDISYNYYNQLGQLIASIAPNGVQGLATKWPQQFNGHIH